MRKWTGEGSRSKCFRMVVSCRPPCDVGLAMTNGLFTIDVEGKNCDRICDEVKQILFFYPTWTNQTRNGGLHFVYKMRNGESPRQENLAVNDAGNVTVEIRGQGNYVLIPPSGDYKNIDEREIRELSPEDFELICSDIRSLSKRPVMARKRPKKPVSNYDGEGVSYDPTLLTNALEWAGWTQVSDEGWCRPEKQGGISATFNGSVFYVFSSECDGFEPDSPYSIPDAMQRIYGDRARMVDEIVFAQTGLQDASGWSKHTLKLLRK